jgi:hypothetical protein
MIAIEKDKPLPPIWRKYPFADMQAGDSFWVPQGDNAARTSHNLVSAASSHGRRKNKRFSVRRDGDGFRVWRIE